MGDPRGGPQGQSGGPASGALAMDLAEVALALQLRGWKGNPVNH